MKNFFMKKFFNLNIIPLNQINFIWFKTIMLSKKSWFECHFLDLNIICFNQINFDFKK